MINRELNYKEADMVFVAELIKDAAQRSPQRVSPWNLHCRAATIFAQLKLFLVVSQTLAMMVNCYEMVALGASSIINIRT